jgi:hypothetical protein
LSERMAAKYSSISTGFIRKEEAWRS